MMSPDIGPAFAALSTRLTAKARALAEARAETNALARRSSALRWRKARLLWPLFTKG
jgi:hypothetical protein